MHRDPKVADLGKTNGVVLAGPDGLGDVVAHLGGVHIEGGDDLDVSDVVPAQLHVHEPRHLVPRFSAAVVLEALHEGAGAIAHAGYSQSDPCH